MRHMHARALTHTHTHIRTYITKRIIHAVKFITQVHADQWVWPCVHNKHVLMHMKLQYASWLISAHIHECSMNVVLLCLNTCTQARARIYVHVFTNLFVQVCKNMNIYTNIYIHVYTDYSQKYTLMLIYQTQTYIHTSP